MGVPDGPANPLCKMVFAEGRRQRVTYDEIDFRSGVLRGTIKHWRKGVNCRFGTIEAVLGALGWDIAVRPSAETIPAGLRQDLEGLLERFGREVPALAILPEVAAMSSQ